MHAAGLIEAVAERASEEIAKLLLDVKNTADASPVFDRRAQTRADVERTPLPSFEQPRVVDGSLMYGIASLPGASAELKAYALRVGAEECRWDFIETLACPEPAEVADLKPDPMLIWFPPRKAPPPADDEPYTIAWQ